MDISVTGRHVSITEPIKQYAHQKIEKVIKNIPKVISVHVILDIEKFYQMAEVVILCGHNITIRAKEVSEDMYTSIDKVSDKISRQVKKYKEKLMHHRPRTNREIILNEDILSSEDETSSEKDPKIIRTEKFEIKPMFIDEAAMQLDLSNDTFKVFLNAQSDRVNVIYRRSDGDFGLIEPNFKE